MAENKTEQAQKMLRNQTLAIAAEESPDLTPSEVGATMDGIVDCDDQDSGVCGLATHCPTISPDSILGNSWTPDSQSRPQRPTKQQIDQWRAEDGKDAAEKWLKTHDPNYKNYKETWQKKE